MILRPEDGPVIQVPAHAVASIAVVLPDAGPIQQRSMLRRTTPIELDMLKRSASDNFLFGMPICWAPIEVGRVEVWPKADQEYLLEIRDVKGGIMGGRPRKLAGKPAAVTPVEHWVEGFRNAARQAGDAMAKRPPTNALPRLTAAGDEEE